MPNISLSRKQPKTLSEKSVGYLKSTKTRSRRWKAALIGLLMIFVTITSGCTSASRPSPEPQKVAVDASLMVEPSYTKQLLKVLSE